MVIFLICGGGYNPHEYTPSSGPGHTQFLDTIRPCWWSSRFLLLAKFWWEFSGFSFSYWQPKSLVEISVLQSKPLFCHISENVILFQSPLLCQVILVSSMQVEIAKLVSIPFFLFFTLLHVKTDSNSFLGIKFCFEYSPWVRSKLIVPLSSHWSGHSSFLWEAAGVVSMPSHFQGCREVTWCQLLFPA